jgi:hypothetical protein
MSRRLLKHGGLATTSLLVGFPAGFVLGVLTAPFWGWSKPQLDLNRWDTVDPLIGCTRSGVEVQL